MCEWRDRPGHGASVDACRHGPIWRTEMPGSRLSTSRSYTEDSVERTIRSRLASASAANRPFSLPSVVGSALAPSGGMRSSFGSRPPAACAHGVAPRNVAFLEDAPPFGTTAQSTLSAERLFRALDGRWIAVAGDRWQAEVYGVTQEGGWRWVQLGLHGAREHMITIRALPTSGISPLILAVTAWLTGSEPGPDVVSVAS